MVDAVGATVYTYTAGNQLLTEDGPFASDTITNTYVNTACALVDDGHGLLIVDAAAEVRLAAYVYDPPLRRASDCTHMVAPLRLSPKGATTCNPKSKDSVGTKRWPFEPP